MWEGTVSMTTGRRLRGARTALQTAALAASLVIAGCAGGTVFTSSEPVGIVVVQLGSQYAPQSSLSATIIGYDDSFKTLIAQSQRGSRIVTAGASDQGPFYLFQVIPGTYVVRDVTGGGQTGRCFADSSIAFDVRAGQAVFVGAVADNNASAASASRAALADNDYRLAAITYSAGDLAEAAEVFNDAVKSRVPLASGGDPRPATFDIRRSAGDAVGNTCRRAGG